MTATLVAAIDVGGTTIKGALVDANAQIVGELDAPTRAGEGPDVVVHGVRRLTADLLDRAEGQRVAAVGVVAPGRIDAAAGVARYAANIGWRDVPLRELLSADTALPVVLAHDVRAGALAERTLGRARGASDCAIVVIGTGIAGVLVCGGTEVIGANGMAGELGHVAVRPDGEWCACGQRGCLEAYASAGAVARRYAMAGGQRRCTADIAAAAAAGTDPLAARIWREAIAALADGLAAVTLLIDPALIVVAGGLAEAGDALLGPLRTACAAALTWREPPLIELSQLGVRAGRLGAAILAWRSLGHTRIGHAGMPA